MNTAMAMKDRITREYAKFFTQTFHNHGMAQTALVAEAMIAAASESLEVVTNPRHAYGVVQKEADKIIDRNPPALPMPTEFR